MRAIKTSQQEPLELKPKIAKISGQNISDFFQAGNNIFLGGGEMFLALLEQP